MQDMGLGVVERHEPKEEIQRAGSRCNPEAARFTEQKQMKPSKHLIHEGHDLSYRTLLSLVPLTKASYLVSSKCSRWVSTLMISTVRGVKVDQH